MTKRVLAALALLLIAGLATAEWQQVGRGNGSAQVSILEQTSSRTVFEVNVPGVELVPVTTDAGEYTRLELPGEVMATIEVGRPQVPKVSVLLAIPNGARVTARATVLGTRTLKVDNVYPLQPPLLECEDAAPFTMDEQFYSRDVSFPGHDVSVIETGVWRDLHVANLQVYPAQVNAARGEVTIASRIRVEVDYSGGSYPAVISENFIPQYGRFIDNFSQLPVRPQMDYEDGIRYLVFCHSNWSSNSWLVDSLLGWVQKRGYDVRMITKSSFTYAEVKDSIRQEYNRHTPPTLEHVLLVGEYAQIPTGTYSGVGKSDFYYMDLLPSPSGDNYPEVSVARFSPSSAADLENQIKKSLKYQKDPATTNNWLDKLTFVAHREQYPGKYSACVRGAYHMPKPYWQPTLDTIMGQFTGNASVTSAVNAGVGILAYRGHGDATEWWSWGTEGSWYNSHVAALSNGDLTPVTHHWACISGDISVSECHTEAWMRKYPGGAVTALGATQASYTYPNHGQCSTLVRATCDTWTITVPGVRDYAGPVFKVADQMSYMDAYLAKYWPGSPYYYNIWMYLTLGDPSMPVWAGGMPQAASVTAPDSIPLGPYAMNVTVQVGGRPVAGALVCAWKDGDFYTTGRTDGTGLVVLDVNAGTAGDVWLTISEGHAASTPHTPILPWEGIVPAGGGGTPQPNMRYVSNQVDDAGGNNNGRFDPGETADIIVTVRNAGNAAAQNVTGLLASGNALFTISDPNSNFGNVPAGSTATNDADRFTAMADNSIPGGTMVPCTLHLHSDNWGDWAYTFTLQVGEPPVPGQYMITLDTGSVRLSVCGIGSIGYDEPPADLGSGFQVPKNAASCLFFGGLMAGNSASYVVDHHFSQPASSGTNHDWAMTD
ncbi:hypothetical protein JXB37_03695, partial [candidate division WOR-3 bacterium]|nr:hypothetical protein [candidate division WOR-3 bacterium]